MPQQRRSESKENNRRSLLRNPLADMQNENGGTDWTLGLRKSLDKARVHESYSDADPKLQQQQEQPQAALGKRGSVRKRLSMLRIGGGGTKKTGNMGSLDEE
jgi:hypothetical protein